MSAAALLLPPGRSLLGRLGLALRIAAVAGLTALAGGFVVFVERLDQTEVLPPRHADGIVVLTGGAERIAGAFDLLLSGEGDRLLISGVNPSTSASDLTRTMPAARRLLGCCIELGYAAENTVGNARETSLWVRRHAIHSLIVVTSNYHMPRALAEIGDAAPGIDLVPFAVVSDRAEGRDRWSDGQRLRLILVEYLKYLVVVARTHLLPSAPYDNTTASLGAPHLRQGGPCSSCARSSSTSSSTSSSSRS